MIDTNVILDVLLKRSPFYETAIEVLKLSTRDDIQEFVSASAITDIYYIAYKNLRDKASSKRASEKTAFDCVRGRCFRGRNPKSTGIGMERF
ncbi:PIN domain-containing protein [Blautia wexlerae]|nr:PIN domain-containing protein [Blautia wexlerae]